MFKIPDEFRDIPEAVELRQAEARFKAAIEQEKRITQDSEKQVHLITGKLRQAQADLQRAQNAFDAATGEPKPVGLTSAVIEEVSCLFPVQEREDVENLLDRSCGRTLPFHRDSSAQKLEHIRLCVLRLSRGDVAKLRQWIEFANVDWRDVIYAASTM